jgi:hypothetical protein
MVRKFFLGAALAAMSMACGAQGPAGSSCTVGATASCVCDNGARGAQVCLPSGAYGACACGADAGADVAPVDAPSIDAPAVDAPAVDAPTVDAPTVDAPAVDAAPDDTGACPTGATRCGADCVDVGNDRAHCGGCGRACASGEGCAAGRCMSLSVDCSSGMCPAGTYCDLGTSRCAPGCGFDEQCPQPGRCESTHRCVCAAAHHLCGSACVSDTSAASCGARCEPCPAAPVNATSVCVSGACQVVCNAGYHRCGDACVSDASVDSCGARCDACPTSVGGRASCVAGVCALTCDAGNHRCGATCARDDDATRCGASCTACPPAANATATCTAGACGFTCNAGFHRCAGACVRDDDIARCGATCVVCPTALNAITACVGGACTLSCGPGTHNCGSTCARDTDPATCGTRCTPCPAAPSNGYATCTAGACGVQCFGGYHTCGSACVSDGAIATCGTRCTPCPTVANATTLCTGGACNFLCNTGYSNCGGVCVATGTDASNCGACGRVCAAGDVCSGGACVARCSVSTDFVAAPVLPGAVGALAPSRDATLDVGDFNGDGNADIAAADFSPTSAGPANAFVYLGNGDGTFRARTTLTMPSPILGLDAGDLDGDGLDDLAMALGDETLRVALVRSAGATFAATTYVAESGPRAVSVRIADLNGDAVADLFVGTVGAAPRVAGPSGARSFLGQRGGPYTSLVADAYGWGAPPSLTVLVDVNRDAVLDAVVNSADMGTVLVRLGNGDGTFRARASAIVNSYQVAAGDFDRDGVVDLASANATFGGGTCPGIELALGLPDGTYAPRRCTNLSSSYVATLAAADFNGDGLLDVLAARSNATLTLLRGDGAGAFTANVGWSAYAARMAAADFNRDGRPDVAFIDAITSTVRVFLNVCR